jgi:hypothetical protein
VTQSGAFGESKMRKDLQCGSKEFKAALGLYPRNLGNQRYNGIEETNGTR